MRDDDAMAVADHSKVNAECLLEPQAVCGGAIQLPANTAGAQRRCFVAIRLPY
jgi:hypothetical protein